MPSCSRRELNEWFGAIVTLAVIAFGSSNAAAGDGRIEINQTCAAVGCFSGDPANFPVTTQAWKSYVLTSDLLVPDANTSAVSLAQGATLDLNGFAIRGPTSCSGTPASCTGTGTGSGIQASGGGNAIRNGTITGMGSAGIVSSQGLLAERLAIVGNGSDGIRTNYGAGADTVVVRDCSIVRNGGIGIYVNFLSPQGMLIEGNLIHGNTSDGIRGNGALVRGNRVSGNGGLGLAAGYGGEGTGYGDNAFINNNGGGNNAQTSGGIQIGTNVCGTDTVCP